MPTRNRRDARPTIKDVALRAGVTDMTVSRVVNGSGPVSQPVRERVENAIADLGYIPSRIARGLRSRRTNTLALVVSDVTNPFFTTVARGVEDAASDRDHLVLLCNTDESEEEEIRYLQMIASQNVDGVLLVPAQTGERARELALRWRLPLVILDRSVPASDLSVVRCDAQSGARAMVEHLSSLGHREILILAGPAEAAPSKDRVSAALQAIEHEGGHGSVVYGKLTAESGREGVERCLALAPRPTAIFALNNFLTIGALQALNDRSVKVPEELSLVGFDDLPLAMVERPFLTVVTQPAYEMGRAAVGVLLDEVAAPVSPKQEVLLPTELLIRGSSGPVPTASTPPR
jgi:LacI family transcriptional regulator